MPSFTPNLGLTTLHNQWRVTGQNSLSGLIRVNTNPNTLQDETSLDTDAAVQYAIGIAVPIAILFAFFLSICCAMCCTRCISIRNVSREMKRREIRIAEIQMQTQAHEITSRSFTSPPPPAPPLNVSDKQPLLLDPVTTTTTTSSPEQQQQPNTTTTPPTNTNKPQPSSITYPHGTVRHAIAIFCLLCCAVALCCAIAYNAQVLAGIGGMVNDIQYGVIFGGQIVNFTNVISGDAIELSISAGSLIKHCPGMPNSILSDIDAAEVRNNKLNIDGNFLFRQLQPIFYSVENGFSTYNAVTISFLVVLLLAVIFLFLYQLLLWLAVDEWQDEDIDKNCCNTAKNCQYSECCCPHKLVRERNWMCVHSTAVFIFWFVFFFFMLLWILSVIMYLVSFVGADFCVPSPEVTMVSLIAPGSETDFTSLVHIANETYMCEGTFENGISEMVTTASDTVDEYFANTIIKPTPICIEAHNNFTSSSVTMLQRIHSFPICIRLVALYVHFMHINACNLFVDGLFAFFISFLIATLFMYVSLFLDLGLTSSIFYRDKLLQQEEQILDEKRQFQYEMDQLRQSQLQLEQQVQQGQQQVEELQKNLGVLKKMEDGGSHLPVTSSVTGEGGNSNSSNNNNQMAIV
jgi:hypothetical protein